ncbi:hypothetical protein EPTV-WA-024 [Eptesipox virus]|uniref:Uncharacterized protein n=1 Tax=Eptesipox virus TaxID=1329402 RepID=A0A220T693_9POXV|nr:hypothetical protein CG743_gp024 [Eptesipox virus]ASK51225.1 hypothetical protein EPTV-WA-024 [Eptesipox virus]WAH70983.1 hypothetical protein CG743_gp024 [Eptesipox virus]
MSSNFLTALKVIFTEDYRQKMYRSLCYYTAVLNYTLANKTLTFTTDDIKKTINETTKCEIVDQELEDFMYFCQRYIICLNVLTPSNIDEISTQINELNSCIKQNDTDFLQCEDMEIDFTECVETTTDE